MEKETIGKKIFLFTLGAIIALAGFSIIDSSLKGIQSFKEVKEKTNESILQIEKIKSSIEYIEEKMQNTRFLCQCGDFIKNRITMKEFENGECQEIKVK